ncbi:T9SS type B sorting domain-containing protein [Flavobacteriaceae bacterium]|nr:T9SS type B sorting domain-containing protein [Flavobacteriaceae bacterium]
MPPTALEMCDMTEITGPGPSDEEEPFDLESKSDEITGGDLTINITYYETQAQADIGDPLDAIISPYINTSNPQTIFIRAEDLNTGCLISQGITLSLVVNPLPSTVTPTPLESCDVSNDGFTFFTLTDKDDEIIGGEPGVEVSYYETRFAAEQALDPLVSPYTNIVTPSQIIYARAEFPVALGGTGCFKITELELIVVPTPVIPVEMEDLVICDGDGDEIVIFDLTLQEAIIIQDGQDPDDYTITYYLSETDAQDGSNPIANPEAFPYTTYPIPQTIWVRLEDNLTECPKIGSFNIRLEIGPEVFEPTPLTQCDDLGEPNDEVTLFDLTAKNEEITGGALGVTVKYYETQADAEQGDPANEIQNDTAYQNISNPQIIWVRVTDVNTGCVDATLSLTIRVEANPEPEQPEQIILCDVTNPGDQQEVFDLTIRQAQILDGENWTLSYHNSFEDAVDNNAPIVTPTAYTNISTPEIIYVRVSIDPTDPQACFEIVELEIIVNPIPDGSAVVTPYVICEILSDEEAVFDLTSKNEEILNGQDPAIFQVLFYESQVDADAMLNPIQEPETYTNLSNPQTIFVVIFNTLTNCFVATQSFDIEEREGAVANTPLKPYAICDYYNDNDGIAEFDLLNQELLDEILGVQNPLEYQLDFYGTLENAELEIAPLPIIYENVINPQIIYARVTNINSECYDITEVILKVEFIPEVTLDPSYRLCVDAAGLPIQEEEGSDSPPVIDTQLDPSIYMFEWQLDGEVLLGEIGASITALQGGNYSVTVTEILTGCMAATDTQVIISSPPLNYNIQVTDAFESQHNITATADGAGEYIFQLDDNPFQESGYFINVVPGSHTITIKDIYGCGSVTTEVAVIDFPRFITPNQDGYHDTWNILGISVGDPTAKIYIFDRFGKLLKQISPTSEGWDGTYNGNPLPSNDYWFRVEYTENNIKKEFSGHFTLKR